MSGPLGEWPRRLAAFDDDALAALANKGLVRRAKKDAEKSPPDVVADEGAALRLAVEGLAVSLRLPPSASTCACDAGVCRHILAALAFVRDSATPSDEPPPVDLAADLLAFDDEAVTRWAGKPLLKKAAVVLARGAEIEEGPASIVVTLSAQNVAVRYLGGGVDALLCDCHAPGPCEHKAAALLAFRAKREGRSVTVEPAALREKTGAARTREEVRAATATLLEEAVALGLSGLSAATEARLRTLATSAHGVDLPRLERSLESLADAARLILARHAAGDAGAFLDSAAACHALCAALASPARSLVGEHRGTYLPVAGTVELIGLGAARWRTPSGYHGLTLYFWEPAAGRWTGWTDARPVDAPGFDPAGRFEQDPPWTGARSPRDAASRRWRVGGLRRNAAGRIASREGSRGLADGDGDAMLGPVVSDFSALPALFDRALALGLTADRSDLDALVLLRPAEWRPASYDAVRQVARREVADAAGVSVPLRLAHGPASGDGLQTLLKTPADRLGPVLGRLTAAGGSRCVEPLTIWVDGRPVHLTLDPTPQDADEPAAAPQPAAGVGGASAVAARVSRAAHVVRDAAEAGVGASRDESAIRAAAESLASAGLTAAADALRAVAESVRRARASTDPSADRAVAAALLRAAYLLRLTREAVGTGGG